MRSLFNRYATPFITGLFFISLITGLALFVHIGPAGFRDMHEILSLVLILPFGLHLWKNWRAFAGYFKRSPMLIALTLSFAMAAPFLIPSGSGGSDDRAAMFGLTRKLMQATPAEVAPLFHLSTQDLTAVLTQAGYSSSPDQTLTDMARKAGKSEAELASLLITLPQQ